MPFSIPTTLTIGSIVQAISKSVTLSEENVHQINLPVSPNTTEEVFLDIIDLTKVKSLFLTTSSPITYSFTSGGTQYNLTSSLMLLGTSNSFQELTEITGGTLVVGQQYYIKTYNSPDDFSNVGAPVSSGATNISFVATGTTPSSWAAQSTLVTRSNTLTSVFLTNSSTGTTATFNAVMVISND